jgi:hypothetical protein
MQRYIAEHPEYSVILPINEYYEKDENGELKMISFGNEIALDMSFVDEMGVINSDELDKYMDFNCTGGLFKTEDFISLGCLKKSMKIAAWYEFLLRAAYKEKKIYVIPKIGYTHLLGRQGSIIETYKKTIDNKESDFWVNVAKKDYFYKEERDKSKYTYDANKKADED